MAETKAAFRRRVGRLLGILTTATLSGAGDTNTGIAVSLTDKFASTNALVGATAYDTAASEARRITTYNPSTGEYDVNRVYTNAQAAARTVEIYTRFTVQELDDALQQALEEAYPYIVTPVVDTSLTGIANQYEYTVPSTIRDLERMYGGRVQWESNTAISTFPYVDALHWEVRTSGETRTLILPEIYTDRTIRLVGWGIPSFPSTDATSIAIPSDTLQLLAYKVGEVAWRTGSVGPAKDAEYAMAMSQTYAAMFDKNKDTMGIKMTPTAMRDNADFPLVDAPLAYFHATPS